METDFITTSVVSQEKLVNTFKPCLFFAWHYQGRGDVSILAVHQKDVESVDEKSRDEKSYCCTQYW